MIVARQFIAWNMSKMRPVPEGRYDLGGETASLKSGANKRRVLAILCPPGRDFRLTDSRQ
jgi:hypothetical protein